MVKQQCDDETKKLICLLSFVFIFGFAAAVVFTLLVKDSQEQFKLMAIIGTNVATISAAFLVFILTQVNKQTKNEKSKK